MDVQLKRGLLDACVLAAIKNKDSYGYQIIKDMKPYLEMSESTLYTILKRLEAARLLTVRSAEHNGRLRKYYHITELGLNRIEEFFSLKTPIMLGISRKSFLGNNEDNNEIRDALSLAISYPTIQKNIDYLRVHNVKLHRQLLNSVI